MKIEVNIRRLSWFVLLSDIPCIVSTGQLHEKSRNISFAKLVIFCVTLHFQIVYFALQLNFACHDGVQNVRYYYNGQSPINKYLNNL